ncbi:MAG: JAB domain-containing protein [Sphingopyxis sp.]
MTAQAKIALNIAPKTAAHGHAHGREALFGALPFPDLIDLFTPFLNTIHREHMVVAGLDDRGRLTAFAEISGCQTRVDGVISAIRAVLAPAATRCIIMAHSHVVGDAKPSPADIAATRHVDRLSRLAGVRLLDHLIYCKGVWVSMSELGCV